MWGFYGGNVEGKEPSLKHSLFNELREVGLSLETPEADTPRQQKRHGNRDKNTGRKVVVLPTRENKQEESVIMNQPSTNENQPTSTSSIETAAARIGESLQSDMTHAVREMHTLRRRFEEQHSLKAELIRGGAMFALITGAVVAGGLVVNKVITRGQPDFPAGKPTK